MPKSPVKGVYVYCPGCGHGGHLEHALEWFAVHEFCPTGCGKIFDFYEYMYQSHIPS